MVNPQLETFLRVADAGSFSKAAEEAFITPTAVIKQINLLENSLGVKLFDRTHRGLTLTKAGQSMYQDAKYIIQYCRDSVTRAKNAMLEDTSVIRVGSSPMTPAQLLMKLWAKVNETCPDIKFQIVPFENTPENAREILGNLGKNIDIVGGIFDETMLSLRGCAGMELVRAPFECAVSIHHRLAVKDRLTLPDLYGENLMLMHRGWSHYVDQLRDEFVAGASADSHCGLRFLQYGHFQPLRKLEQCAAVHFRLGQCASAAEKHPRRLESQHPLWHHALPDPQPNRAALSGCRTGRQQRHVHLIITQRYRPVNETRLLRESRFVYHRIDTEGSEVVNRMILWLLMLCILPVSALGEEAVDMQTITRDTRIQSVITDPVFGDYGRLLFPVDTGYYSGDTLGNLHLTWYTHIDPNETVEIISTLRNRVLAGETVFYDIYTDEEKAADPAKRDMGLFFFRGTPGAKFAVCNAGGGFAYVGAMQDSFPHALELSKQGYNAFALIYRPGAQTACEDLSRAISFIFANAEMLQVDTRDYSLWGGSAGGRMAAWVASYGTAAFGGDELPRRQR